MQYPTPKHLENLLSISTQKSNARELEGKVVCECGSEEFELLYVGRRKEEKEQLVSLTNKHISVPLLNTCRVVSPVANLYTLFCIWCAQQILVKANIIA